MLTGATGVRGSHALCHVEVAIKFEIVSVKVLESAHTAFRNKREFVVLLIVKFTVFGPTYELIKFDFDHAPVEIGGTKLINEKVDT